MTILWTTSINGLNNYLLKAFPTNIYFFKVNNRNTRKSCEICSKLIKTPKRRYWHRLKYWTYSTHFSSVTIADFEQVNLSLVSKEAVIKVKSLKMFQDKEKDTKARSRVLFLKLNNFKDFWRSIWKVWNLQLSWEFQCHFTKGRTTTEIQKPLFIYISHSVFVNFFSGFVY